MLLFWPFKILAMHFSFGFFNRVLVTETEFPHYRLWLIVDLEWKCFNLFRCLGSCVWQTLLNHPMLLFAQKRMVMKLGVSFFQKMTFPSSTFTMALHRCRFVLTHLLLWHIRCNTFPRSVLSCFKRADHLLQHCSTPIHQAV